MAVPTTVVVGSRDLLTPPRLGRALAAAIPGARLVELPGAGHMLPYEEPDRLAEIILSAAPTQRRCVVTATRTADEFTVMVGRLNKLSVERHFDAYADIDWDDPDVRPRHHRPPPRTARPSTRCATPTGTPRSRRPTCGPPSAATAGPPA